MQTVNKEQLTPCHRMPILRRDDHQKTATDKIMRGYIQKLIISSIPLLALSFGGAINSVVSAQTLPANQPMQLAMDGCTISASTVTSTYVIEVCVKSDKKGNMILQNQKTGEKLTLPATQVDRDGNVFSANVTKAERINNKGFLPFISRQTTTYLLDISKKEFSITKQTNLPNRKTVQVEKTGAILAS
ncbi:hypothetical protein H6G81_02295 [Scytonema hofmannii FACHB-248]|uniref:Uncharacterized protein n=1 Tax=Scytonema hofmannii FACHB-248 TaxID=1842502 RepID=A0ABR8GKX5_9CYAN|nr:MULTISPECIES: hypothetical protein [Nostocales]MBD2603388.1 hypothetical protein [Scytonema hofmannii FACHB-248]